MRVLGVCLLSCALALCSCAVSRGCGFTFTELSPAQPSVGDWTLVQVNEDGSVIAVQSGCEVVLPPPAGLVPGKPHLIASSYAAQTATIRERVTSTIVDWGWSN